MATQYEPIVKDSTLNTTEQTSRNLADVLAEELKNIANNVKPDGSDISIDVPGMSATNVDDGFSELKGTLTTKIGFADISSGSINDITETGIYYLRNAVTGKPVNQNGMFIVTSISNSVKLGIYVPNATNGYFYVCTWENSTWIGHLNATS